MPNTGLDQFAQLLKNLQLVDATQLDNVIAQLRQRRGDSGPISPAELMKELVVTLHCCTQGEAEHLLRVRPPELIRALAAFAREPPIILSKPRHLPLVQTQSRVALHYGKLRGAIARYTRQHAAIKFKRRN